MIEIRLPRKQLAGNDFRSAGKQGEKKTRKPANYLKTIVYRQFGYPNYGRTDISYLLLSLTPLY